MGQSHGEWYVNSRLLLCFPNLLEYVLKKGQYQQQETTLIQDQN